MANLLEQTKSYFNPVFIEQSAQSLGESAQSVVRIVNGAAAVLLAGIIQKLEKPEALDAVYKLLKEITPESMPDLHGLLHSGNLAHNDPRDGAGKLYALVFGPQTNAVFNAISAFAEARPEQTQALAGVSGTVVVRVLGKHLLREELSVAGFSNLLKQEKDTVYGALPSGLSGILGLNAAEGAQPADTMTNNSNAWFKGLLLFFAIAALFLFFAKKYHF